MTRTMRAARLHEVGQPMRVEEVPVPTPGPKDVLVAVRAVNIVPNLANILSNWTTWFPMNPLPSLPAIFGLDPAGVIEEVGAEVEGFSVGDRVYVNPARNCEGCRACREGRLVHCASFAFAGYFGFSPSSLELLDRYQGGLAEYMIGPAQALVSIPDSLSFEAAARFGYLGTMYSALRKAAAGSGRSVLVNGITGTLGIAAALLAPGLGITRLYGTGRDRELLDEVDKLAPGRFRLHSLLDGPVDEWITAETGGTGVDIYIDALGPGAARDTAAGSALPESWRHRRQHRCRRRRGAPGSPPDDGHGSDGSRLRLVHRGRRPGHGGHGRRRVAGPLAAGASRLRARGRQPGDQQHRRAPRRFQQLHHRSEPLALKVGVPACSAA